MTAAPDLVRALAPWLAQRLGAQEVAIRDLRRHSEGFSWHTYTLAAQWRDPATGAPRTQRFAVRREPEDGLLPPYDAVAQHAVHAAVQAAADIPVPALRWLETDPAVLGRRFYVMDALDGHVPVQWRPDDPVAFPTPAARQRIGEQFVDILGRIHAVDWRAAGLAAHLPVPADAEAAARLQIERWERAYAESVLVEVPLLRTAFAWLRGNVATSGRLGLVHGDYRLGNFMVRDGRIVGVFDWELAHLSDPVEDIAYSGLALFRGRSPLWSHLLPREAYLGRYRERTGLDVADDVLRFWTVLGEVKAAVPHLRACRAFEDGRTGDVRLAAMGHQVLYVLRALAVDLGLRERG